MATRITGNAQNAATAQVLRGLKAEVGLGYAQLADATGIKEAHLKRLFTDQAIWTLDAFSDVTLALGADPAATFASVRSKVSGQ